MNDKDFKIILTDDGSNSLIHHLFDETYHSNSGAVGESSHIYIDKGLKVAAQRSNNIRILEFGFGTGLNLLLTIELAIKENLTIDYHTIELYPLSIEKVEQLNYSKFCTKECHNFFIEAHKSPNFTKIKLFENFDIQKYHASFLEYQNFPADIDLVYFDAFSYDTNPELWSIELFSNIFAQMNPSASLVTYASKGVIKENLRQAGFFVKRLKGAMGKRHMVVATKP